MHDIELVGRSDTGRVRSHNEDCIGEDATLGIAVLADGMGGYQGGEVASGIAVQTVLETLREGLLTLPAGAVDEETGYLQVTLLARRAVIRANQAIFQAAQDGRGYQGMGTTLVMAVFQQRHVIIAHVGDSRLYRYRNGLLKQLTLDHSMVQEMVNRGYCTPDEARGALNRNLVTRALGVEASVAVDLQEEMALPGDLYLLCSDGLNDMLSDAEISTLLARHGDRLELSAERLIQQANERGGRDNISVILARPLGFDRPRTPWYKRLLGK